MKRKRRGSGRGRGKRIAVIRRSHRLPTLAVCASGTRPVVLGNVRQSFVSKHYWPSSSREDSQLRKTKAAMVDYIFLVSFETIEEEEQHEDDEVENGKEEEEDKKRKRKRNRKRKTRRQPEKKARRLEGNQTTQQTFVASAQCDVRRRKVDKKAKTEEGKMKATREKKTTRQ
jgi:hypothetical protein